MSFQARAQGTLNWKFNLQILSRGLITGRKSMLQGLRKERRMGRLQLGTICAKKGSDTQPNKGVKMETLEIPGHKLYFTNVFCQSVGE